MHEQTSNRILEEASIPTSINGPEGRAKEVARKRKETINKMVSISNGY